VAGDGSERHNLEQQTAELGLRDAVDFAGGVEPSKLLDLMNTATGSGAI